MICWPIVLESTTPDGKVGTYLELKDQDRIFIIFFDKELTFQKR